MGWHDQYLDFNQIQMHMQPSCSELLLLGNEVKWGKTLNGLIKFATAKKLKCHHYGNVSARLYPHLFLQSGSCDLPLLMNERGKHTKNNEERSEGWSIHEALEPIVRFLAPNLISLGGPALHNGFSHLLGSLCAPRGTSRPCVLCSGKWQWSFPLWTKLGKSQVM